MSAILTLICYILQNPSESVSIDIKLLTATGHVNERVLSRQKSQASAPAHLESVVEFIPTLENVVYMSINNTAGLLPARLK